MKNYILLAVMTVMVMGLAAMPVPRIYVQRLVLDDGSMPLVTQEEGKSASEYTLTAQILEIEEAFMSTETHPIHSVAVKNTGDGVRFPHMVIVSIQLGNFRVDWKPGQTMRMVLTHNESGEKVSWDLEIPEGSNLIRHLDEAIVIPPFTRSQ